MNDIREMYEAAPGLAVTVGSLPGVGGALTGPPGGSAAGPLPLPPGSA